MSDYAITSNSGEQLLLTWETVLDKFDNLIKYAAKQKATNRNLDNMMSAEDLYQEGLIKLYDCWEIWCLGHNKDMKEFGAIFKVSLFRHVNGEAGASVDNHTDVDSLQYLLEDPKQTDITTKLYIEHGLSVLRDSLSSEIAKTILDELINPSDATLYQVHADIARKTFMKAQGRRVNIPSDTTVRMKHIQRAMGVSNSVYENAMREIRSLAPQVLDEIYHGGN